MSLTCQLLKMFVAMKLTVFLLCIFSLTGYSMSYSQGISLNIRNKPIEQVFELIEKQSEFTFFYKYNDLQKANTVTAFINGATIDEVLKVVLTNQPFNYTIRNKTIIISAKVAQEKTEGIKSPDAVIIRGKVNDVDGNPLSGVSVVYKGTASGTVTDNQGNFSLDVRNASGTLIVSLIGYKTQEIPLNGQQNVTIILERSETELDQVVVVGYGTQRRADLTGAISSIRSDEITRTNPTTMLSGLQGKVAGVQMSSSSGQPGAGTNIIIRGASSIYGTSTPLFVIDGVQIDINNGEVAGSRIANSTVTDPLANINPSDIESIEVLKDASATAIYGSRGANGVVIVTTKSGKSGKPVITYDGYVSFGKATKRLDLLSGDEYIAYQKVLRPLNVLFYYPDPTTGIADTTRPRDLSLISRHDWQSEIFRTAISNNHSLSVAGGTKGLRAIASVGYMNEQGIIINNNNERFSARLGLNADVTSKLKFGLNLNSALNVLKGASGNGNANDQNGIVQRIIFSKPIAFLDSTSEPFDYYVSPKSMVENAYRNVTTLKTLYEVFGSYQLAKGLQFKSTVSGFFSNSKGKEFYGSNTSQGVNYNGLGDINNVQSYSWTNTNQLNYQRKFNEKHNLNLLGAFEKYSYTLESNEVQTSNYPIQTSGADDIAMGSVIQVNESNKWRNNRMSFISRANYSYLNRYLFTLTFRADGSDKFGPGHKWGYFPSGSFAWRISEENFMKEVSWIMDLKLRLSYGKTGNERIPAYTYLPAMEKSYYATYGAAQLGMSTAVKANPLLKWEATDQFNVGLDFSLIQNRLNVTADYYVKQTKDNLMPVLLPTQSGFNSQWQNLGRVDNNGFELTINSRNIDRSGFKWTSAFNISTNKNVVKNLGGATIIPVNVPGRTFSGPWGAVVIGESIGTGYGFVYDGVYQINDFIWQNNSDPAIPYSQRTFTLKPGVVSFAGATVAPGHFKFKDLNGDSTIDEQHDKTVISRSNPKYFGGLSNTFTYKNIDLNISTEWTVGNEIMNIGTYSLNGFQPDENLLRDFYYNRWTPDNPTNKYGVFALNNSTSKYASTYYVEDGSFFRIKTVTLGYNIPSRILSNKNIRNIRLYASVNNVYTFTNYSSFDPEISSNNQLLRGFDVVTYPRARTFLLGVNVSF